MTSKSREEGRRVLAEVRARAKKEAAAAAEGSNIIALKPPVAGHDVLDVAEKWQRPRNGARLMRACLMIVGASFPLFRWRLCLLPSLNLLNAQHMPLA